MSEKVITNQVSQQKSDIAGLLLPPEKVSICRPPPFYRWRHMWTAPNIPWLSRLFVSFTFYQQTLNSTHFSSNYFVGQCSTSKCLGVISIFVFGPNWCKAVVVWVATRCHWWHFGVLALWWLTRQRSVHFPASCLLL